MKILQRIFERLNKPTKPVMHITKYGEESYWIQMSNSDLGHFATKEEIQDFKDQGLI